MLKNAVQDMFGVATDHITGRINRPEEVDFVDRQKKEWSRPLVAEVNPILSKRSSLVPSNDDVFEQPMFNSTQKPLRGNPVTKFKNMFLGKRTDVTLYEESMRDFRPFSGPRNANQTEFGRNWRTPDNLLSNRNLFHDAMRKGRRTQGDGCDRVYDVEEKNCEDREDLVTGWFAAVLSVLLSTSIKGLFECWVLSQTLCALFERVC